MRKLTPHLALLAFTLGLYSTVLNPASAGFIVSSDMVDVVPGSTGYVQLLLTNDFGSSQEISGFSLDVLLTGTGVLFTAIDDQTTTPYIFDGFGTGTLTFDPFPSINFTASDVSFNVDGFVTLAANQTVGLGRIAFEVNRAAAGGLRPITFTAGPTTMFIDGAGNPFTDADIAFNSGGINVQGATTVVPEPSSLVLWGIGAGCALIVLHRSRKPEAIGSRIA